MTHSSRIRHIVFFSAKDKKDIGKIVKGLSMLKQIPHASVFDVRENTQSDALSSDVDVVVYAEFADQDALAAYKSDPIYQKSIDVVRPLRNMRVAADIGI